MAIIVLWAPMDPLLVAALLVVAACMAVVLSLQKSLKDVNVRLSMCEQYVRDLIMSELMPGAMLNGTNREWVTEISAGETITLSDAEIKKLMDDNRSGKWRSHLATVDRGGRNTIPVVSSTESGVELCDLIRKYRPEPINKPVADTECDEQERTQRTAAADVLTPVPAPDTGSELRDMIRKYRPSPFNATPGVNCDWISADDGSGGKGIPVGGSLTAPLS
jgi:hypothetical protein